MSWWHRLWRRSKLEDQLEKELRFHMEQHTADLIAQGHAPEEARRQVRLAIGGPEQVKEQCRDARGTRWLEDLWQDIRYALRALRQRPGFAVVALSTLALGTGAVTVMFTVINGVLLKPMPYPHPERLVNVDEQTKGITDYRWGDRWAFAYPNFLDCQRESRSLDLMAWRYGGGTVSGVGEPEYVDGLQVSSNVFSALGVKLFLGRSFLPEEDRRGAAPVIIISYALWQRRFAGNPSAIGMPLVFGGTSYTVIGVVPADFRSRDADVYTPLGQNPGRFMQNREAHPGIRVWARLREGVALAAAQGELDAIGRHLAEQYPKSNAGRGFVVEPLRPNVGNVRSTLWLLLGAVSLVSLIACTNVASLLLARAVSRQRELAMRVALGAGRGRLVRQCLTESVVLALAGGALGILLAAIGIQPFVVLWPGSLPRADYVRLDWHVLFFAVGVSIVSGLLLGLAPALRAPSRELEQTLRAGARTILGNSRRLHTSFVSSEIAIAVVLLVSAGMLGRTLLRLSSLDPGVNIRNVLAARMAISPAVLTEPARIRSTWEDVLDRARAVPGVLAVAMVDTVPMREGDNQLGYWTAPPAPPRAQMPLALANSVTPDYLKVMGIPLRRGRFFDARDRKGSEFVIVIDDVMAQHVFGGQDPVGKRLWSQLVPEPMRIVGVVGHVRQWGLAADDQAPVRDQFYYPFAQVPDEYLRRWSELMSIAVRTGDAPLNFLEPLRRQLRGAAGDQVLYQVRTMEQLASATVARQRFLLVLFGVFAGLALLLAGIGIYGVLAYLTNQRVPEIGVRIALGANNRDVMGMVMRQSLGMILVGVGAGLLAAFAVGRVLQRLVEGMQPNTPSTFAIMIPVLLFAALFASFLPARRASRVDPVRALRQE
jgi:putative ABC transport system permease protein